MSLKIKMMGKSILLLLLLSGVLFAQEEGVDYSDPATTSCDDTGIVGLACNTMQVLLALGPFLAIIALLLGGMIYIYANIFVTADQRGRYHSLATSLAVGAIILAALVGGAGLIVEGGTKIIS